MTAQEKPYEDHEERREAGNTLRILGGLLLMVALLLYFFHLAESSLGRHMIGLLAAAFAAAGAVLFAVGHYRLKRSR